MTAEGERAAPVDVLLLFPGVTEARFFPYLSLPVLTGYLRANGVRVEQRDLNLMLLDRLSDPAFAAPGDDDRLLRYAGANAAELRAAAFDGVSNAFPFDVAHKILRDAVEKRLRGSVLTARNRELSELVRQACAPAPDDLAARLHSDLVREVVEETRPAVVGVSIAFFSQLGPALRLAHQVKAEHPGTSVVFGGQQVMLRGDQLAATEGLFDLVDVLCTGAGEETLLEVVRRIGGSSEESPPVGSLTASGVASPSTHHLRDNPPPVFDGLPFHRYLVDEPQLPVISCIGCYWGRCVFCSYGNRSLSSGYQQLSAPQLADNCADGLDRTGARWITFVDENCNLRLLLKATRLLHERGYRIRWASRNRLERELADPRFCLDLADAGCRLMSVGYETSSQRLLDLMDKGVDAGLYQQIVDNLHAAGIGLRFSVMGGLFDETTAESEESRDFLVRNAPKIGIDVMQMLIVEPHTRLAADPRTYGIELDADDRPRANDEFSYLGGRVGVRHDFTSGGDWQERSAELTATMQAVLPGKNDSLHPSFRAAPPVREQGTAALDLFRWVVHEGHGDRYQLVDLHWSIAYRVLGDVAYDRARHRLSAHSGRARVVLERLFHAGIGTRAEHGAIADEGETA